MIAKKVLDNLRAKLPLSLPMFLASLGIDEVRAPDGEGSSSSSGFDTLEKVRAAKLEDLATLTGSGRRRRAERRGRAQRAPAEIERLLAVGRRAGRAEVRPAAALTGKNILLHRRAPACRARRYEELVEKHGGTVLSGVTKELNYLVMSDPDVAVEQGGEGAQVRDEVHRRGGVPRDARRRDGGRQGWQ